MSWLNAAAYLLKDFLAVFSMLSAMKKLFLKELNIKNIKVLLCAFIFVANAFGGIFFFEGRIEEPYTLMDAVSNLLYILILLFAVNGVKIFKTFFSVMLYIFTVDMLFSLVSPYISNVLYAECIVNSILFALICVIIEYASKRITVNILPKIFSEIPKWVFATLFLFDLTCYYKEFGISSDWYNIFYIISCVAVILCVFYLVFKVVYLAYEQNAVLKQLTMQADYVQSTLNSDEELRRFRHDYKNHMLVVNSLLESGKNQEAREYLSSISGGINNITGKIKSGNFTADAIINSKAIVCEKKNIKIELIGKIPPMGMRSEDICTLLANLIDNAIEASENLENQKAIIIESIVINDNLILSISNPVKDNFKINGQKLKTTKSNKKLHGFGIQNIERIAEKYSGAVTFECENKTFTANVRIKLQKDEQQCSV